MTLNSHSSHDNIQTSPILQGSEKLQLALCWKLTTVLTKSSDNLYNLITLVYKILVKNAIYLDYAWFTLICRNRRRVRAEIPSKYFKTYYDQNPDIKQHTHRDL